MTLERMHTDSNTKPGDAKADTRSFWELLTKLYREKVNAIFTERKRAAGAAFRSRRCAIAIKSPRSPAAYSLQI